ncbi:MAG TPA: DUF1611 domain-containing protein [bacterium]|nr:DUF1611 domain-containing protein [bacterium]
MRSQRMVILAEGKFGVLTSKTAACLIRYQPERVACVLDSTKAGLDAQRVLGFGGSVPVVASIADALRFEPDSLLVGIAPRGGLLPEAWRPIVIAAIENGLDIISGLHTLLSEDPELSRAARGGKVTIWDVRKPTLPDGVSRGLLKHRKGRVILTVGSDCSSGKMTVAYELVEFMKARGVKAAFVPTGQTGILLAGWGQAVDRVPGDFMARVIEDLTVEALAGSDVAVVEGQGSLIHPAYSGVTLAVLHGCWPDAMILCHQPTRTKIEDFEITIPPLSDLVRIYEAASRPVFASRVVAVALNTYDLAEAEARRAVAAAERDTGLPADDPVRWGSERIYASLEGRP